MQQFWDERYAAPAFAYGTEPNVFLKAQLDGLTPGSILFPCEGEGRNAVYAASLGWKVSAFDYSISGRNKALMLANQQDVDLSYRIIQAELADYPENSFDAIALIYAHFEPELRSKFHQRCVSWLKPGGRIIMEAFNPEQLLYFSGGPKNPEMLYTEKKLTDDFDTLQIEHLQTSITDLDEGPFHRGKAAVIQFTGIKPSM
jgi:SAM-dependent methyltransferase